MRGIIMQARSVLGLLRGSKTQTRRLAGDRAVPLYVVGETLYVKETVVCTWNDGERAFTFTQYAADGARSPIDNWPWARKTLSPVFMPRRARRIEVTVTAAVRQRLQQITNADADAEGVEEYDGMLDDVDLYAAAKRFGGMATDARVWYLTAWDEMHGGRDKHGNPKPTSARANPKVDAYTFTVRVL